MAKLNLDFQKLRGQGYDNGSNVAGIYNGAQAHILEKVRSLYKFLAAHLIYHCDENMMKDVLGVPKYYAAVLVPAASHYTERKLLTVSLLVDKMESLQELEKHKPRKFSSKLRNRVWKNALGL